MKPQRSAYLESQAFQAGEFQRSQASFDRQVDGLADLLCERVGEAMRTRLQEDVAQEWVDAAHRVLETLLPGVRGAEHDLAQTALDLQGALRESPRLSDAAIESEIRACSEELAQLVLGRWFEQLHALSMAEAGEPLNANMLPGTRSIEGVLDGIDFAAYAVTDAAVALAVRAYRERLIADAEGGIIEFGPRLHIDFDATNPHQPFTAFLKREDALRAQAMRKTQAREEAAVSILPAPEPLWEMGSILETLGAVRQATLPGTRERCVDLRTLGQAVAAWLGDAPAAMPSAPTENAEMLLLESIGMGVDIFSCGLSANLAEAKRMLRDRSSGIRERLYGYADARDIKVGAATDIFAMSVAVGVAGQFQSLGLDPLATEAAMRQLTEKFGAVYGVSSETVEQLVGDSRTTTAHMVGGAASA